MVYNVKNGSLRKRFTVASQVANCDTPIHTNKQSLCHVIVILCEIWFMMGGMVPSENGYIMTSQVAGCDIFCSSSCCSFTVDVLPITKMNNNATVLCQRNPTKALEKKPLKVMLRYAQYLLPLFTRCVLVAALIAMIPIPTEIIANKPTTDMQQVNGDHLMCGISIALCIDILTPAK